MSGIASLVRPPRLVAAAVLALFFAILSPSADGAWRGGGTGTGGARAKTLGRGGTPSVSITRAKSSTSVTLTWAAAGFAEGGDASSYVVRRYNAATGAVGEPTGSCSGNIAALTCTDPSVPKGTWQYTVTPAVASWHGAESAKSGAVSG